MCVREPMCSSSIYICTCTAHLLDSMQETIPSTSSGIPTHFNYTTQKIEPQRFLIALNGT